MRPWAKKWVWHVLSLLLAAGVLTALLCSQRWDRLANVRLDWAWLAAAAAVAAIYWTLRTLRWRWMAACEGQRISHGRAWLSMLAGLGVGLVTPLRGGEVVRPLFLPQGGRVRLAGRVVIERIFDLSAVLTLCLLGLAYVARDPELGAVVTGRSGGGLGMAVYCLPLAALLLTAALGGPALVLYRPARLWRLLTHLLPSKAKELAEVRLTWRQFRVFFVTSLAAEALSILTVYCCLRAFGPIGLWPVVALTPVVMLNNLVPLTPGGFGIREALAVGIFGAIGPEGFSGPMVLAAYLINGLIVLVIPGAAGVAAAWAVGVFRKETPAAEAQRRGEKMM